MASQDEKEQATSTDGKAGPRRKPLTEAQLKRLTKCHEHAVTQAASKKFDYATDLFTSCLEGDPSNLLYLQGFIVNLKAKYGDPKKISQMTTFGLRSGRSAMKKAISQEAYDDAFHAGWDVLKVNPWDTETLVMLGTASEKAALEGDAQMFANFFACQLYYLKCAYEANPKNADTCRTLALALHKQNRLDDAIQFWHRLEQIRPNDEEAARQIASLLVEKQVNDRKGDSGEQVQRGGKKEELSQEERLKRRIQRQPDDISGYHELANYYLGIDRFSDAEKTYREALALSKNDPELVEKIEDVQIRTLRSKQMAAATKFQKTGAENDKKEVERLQRMVLDKELDLFKGRCERYPSQLVFRYELAQRYQMMGDYQKAIAEFQTAKHDPRKKGLCLLKLGECFRSIKQYQLAQRHFEEAVQEIPDRDVEVKKLAIYRSGKLALGLGNLDLAEKHLTQLAGMDFNFRDVSQLLGEIQRRRQKASGQNDRNT